MQDRFLRYLPQIHVLEAEKLTDSYARCSLPQQKPPVKNRICRSLIYFLAPQLRPLFVITSVSSSITVADFYPIGCANG